MTKFQKTGKAPTLCNEKNKCIKLGYLYPKTDVENAFNRTGKLLLYINMSEYGVSYYILIFTFGRKKKKDISGSMVVQSGKSHKTRELRSFVLVFVRALI